VIRLSRFRAGIAISAVVLIAIYWATKSGRESSEDSGESANAIPNSKTQDSQPTRSDFSAKEQQEWDEERKKLGIPIERTPVVSYEMGAILRCIGNYSNVFHEYPEGSNAEVAKALLGQNEENRKFLAWRPQDISPSGGLKDPWGTEYHLRVEANGKVELRSAGPDRLMWTEDDVKPTERPSSN
jgi:hypothetical protein